MNAFSGSHQLVNDLVHSAVGSGEMQFHRLCMLLARLPEECILNLFAFFVEWEQQRGREMIPLSQGSKVHIIERS
jgi:hypothetical protein